MTVARTESYSLQSSKEKNSEVRAPQVVVSYLYRFQCIVSQVTVSCKHSLTQLHENCRDHPITLTASVNSRPTSIHLLATHKPIRKLLFNLLFKETVYIQAED